MLGSVRSQLSTYAFMISGHSHPSQHRTSSQRDRMLHPRSNQVIAGFQGRMSRNTAFEPFLGLATRPNEDGARERYKELTTLASTSFSCPLKRFNSSWCASLRGLRYPGMYLRIGYASTFHAPGRMVYPSSVRHRSTDCTIGSSNRWGTLPYARAITTEAAYLYFDQIGACEWRETSVLARVLLVFVWIGDDIQEQCFRRLH